MRLLARRVVAIAAKAILAAAAAAALFAPSRGEKGAPPVAAHLAKNAKAKFGVFTANAKKPAFSFLATSAGAVTFGAKASLPVVADFDGDDHADFGVYMSNAKEPYFQRLFSSSKFRETRILPMGSKGDVPVVGVYEAGCPAAPAVWTGSVWTYIDSNWDDQVLTDK